MKNNMSKGKMAAAVIGDMMIILLVLGIIAFSTPSEAEAKALHTEEVVITEQLKTQTEAYDIYRYVKQRLSQFGEWYLSELNEILTDRKSVV